MKSKRILLVDQDTELLEQLAQRCSGVGLVVDQASEALAAVTLLQRNLPDLICLDVQVPGGNGLPLCDMVLASPDDVPCPVIILTKSADDATKHRSTDMCVYYVQKRPDVWRYLEPVIYELVDIQPARRRPNDEERDLSEYMS